MVRLRGAARRRPRRSAGEWRARPWLAYTQRPPTRPEDTVVVTSGASPARSSLVQLSEERKVRDHFMPYGLPGPSFEAETALAADLASRPHLRASTLTISRPLVVPPQDPLEVATRPDHTETGRRTSSPPASQLRQRFVAFTRHKRRGATAGGRREFTDGLFWVFSSWRGPVPSTTSDLGPPTPDFRRRL